MACGCERSLRSKRFSVDIIEELRQHAVKRISTLRTRRGAMEVLKVLFSSTVNRSTTRLVRPPRTELTSNASRSNLIPPLTAAVSRSRARVGGFMRLKKPSGICSGRVLHSSKPRGHRAKGSAVAAAAASAGARELCERRKRAGTFSGTLPKRLTKSPKMYS